MPDPDKTSGWHMHQKTPYKFNAGNGQFLPLSFFPVILNGKSNIFIIHMDDAVIADSDPRFSFFMLSITMDECSGYILVV